VAAGADSLGMLDAETTRRFAHWLSKRVGKNVEVARVATPKTGGG
jgi:hypothetical protein